MHHRTNVLTLQIIPVDGDELATAITKTIACVDLNECDRYSCHTNAACENRFGNFCYTCNVGFTDEFATKTDNCSEKMELAIKMLFASRARTTPDTSKLLATEVFASMLTNTLSVSTTATSSFALATFVPPKIHSVT